MNTCLYCPNSTKGKVCMAVSCQTKKKNQHRIDNLDRYHANQKQERAKNYSKRRANALVQASKRYYSNNLCYVTTLMFQHTRSRAKKYGMSFEIDVDFLTELFNNQDNKCALTNIPFEYEKSTENGTHRRPFAPSLDRIDSKGGYTKDNVRLVCIIVNFALSEFGDLSFDKMCKAYCNNLVR